MENLNYQPVGQGRKTFPKHWMTDNTGDNICEKNQYYDMYTFHYWLWKNYLDKFEKEKWICFSTYRRFWKNKNSDNHKELKNKIIQSPPIEWNNFETILTEPTDLRNIKISKIWKKGKKIIIKNPLLLFNKNKRNIKFHFDLMHGYKNLDRAIELLDTEDRNDFKEFVNTETSFNPHNMFICKSKNILKNYYSTIFPWLERCENLFGFKDLKGFGKIRVYGFLAERFLSYWFKKNYEFKTMPIIFYDIKKDFNYKPL